MFLVSVLAVFLNVSFAGLASNVESGNHIHSDYLLSPGWIIVLWFVEMLKLIRGIFLLIVPSFFRRRSSMKVRYLLSPLSHKRTNENILPRGMGPLNTRSSQFNYDDDAIVTVWI